MTLMLLICLYFNFLWFLCVLKTMVPTVSSSTGHQTVLRQQKFMTKPFVYAWIYVERLKGTGLGCIEIITP